MTKKIHTYNIQNKIHTIRDTQVMLDRDLAKLYGVETRVLNQAVKRNMNRFPTEFMFQLNKTELEDWKSQIVISNSILKSQNVILNKKQGQHSKYLPYAFTEPGAVMLSSVLKSRIAVKVSIEVVKAFVKMRKFLTINAHIFQRLESIEQKQVKTNKNVQKILKAIENPSFKPEQRNFS